MAIGTGVAASVAADRCRSAGWRVAVVDHQPFGGTCALRGCDRKKVPVGAAEAVDHAGRIVVAANVLKGNHLKSNYAGVPSVAFTIPPIASVGLSEKRAHEQSRKVRVICKQASDWYTARLLSGSAVPRY